MNKEKECIRNRCNKGLCKLDSITPCEKDCIKEELDKYLSWIIRDKLGQIKIDGWARVILIQKGQLFIDSDCENNWEQKTLIYEDLKNEIFEYIKEGHKVEVEGLGYWRTF